MSYHDPSAPTGDLLDRVEAQLPSMSRSDVKIARKLLAAPDAFVQSSVRTIASDLGISEPTVIRFCRNVGCEGFKDLKFRATRELAFRQAQRDAALPPADQSDDQKQEAYSASNAAVRMHHKASEALDLALAKADAATIQRAAEMVAHAHKVTIFGIGGSSAVLAEELHNRLYRLGLASTVFTDSYAQRMAAATLQEGDVALFVSSTGRPRALQDAVELAKYYGAGSVAISDADTPLGRAVDVCIDIPLSQAGVHEFQPNPMRYSQMLAIDFLSFQVAESLGPKAKQALRQTRASIASLHGIAPQQPIGD